MNHHLQIKSSLFSFFILFLFYLYSLTSAIDHHSPTSEEKLPTPPAAQQQALSSDQTFPPTSSEDSFKLHAFRIENGWSQLDRNVTLIYSDERFSLRLIGQGFLASSLTLFNTTTLAVSFTFKRARRGQPCDDLRHTDIFVAVTSSDASVVFDDVVLSPHVHPLFFCLRRQNLTSGQLGHFIHQGDDQWLVLGTTPKPIRSYLLPLWLQIITIVVLLIFSGLFSGLNLGLMSLDKTELDILMASGTDRERRYAKTILPLRKRGNFLLCTILLGNVLVNNCLTILLDDLTGSGWWAIVGATLAIVVFGEIIPQAVCSRYGLAVGARTIWFTRLFMVVTFPLSFPISLLLDRILGEEIGYIYNRERLRELLRLTEKDMGLAKDEVNIIAGALELSKKTVGDIMTKINDVFMIEYHYILDFQTMTEIMESGYTRIPVYDRCRSNVVALLNTKDLAFVDPDDKIPLDTVIKFYDHQPQFVFDDVKLNVMLQEFKKGNSHMAMVQTVVDEGPGDPFYQVVGLVTLEDVIEEIIQSEIYDEFDTVTDNRNRQPRKTKRKDYSVFNQPTHENVPRLSPQLQLATFQFLSATLVPFKPPHMTDRILHKLLSQNVVMEYKMRPDEPPLMLFEHGRPADYFVLVVQGRVEVQCGHECLTYEAGCFAHFGLQALLVPAGGTDNIRCSGENGFIYRSMVNLNGDTNRNSFKSSLTNQNFQQRSPKKIEDSNCSRPTSPVSADDSNLVPASGPFIPDYTVQVVADLQYLKIRRDQYLIAWQASRLEQGLQRDTVRSVDNGAEETFEREWRRTNAIFVPDVKCAMQPKRKPMGRPSLTSFLRQGALSVTGSLRLHEAPQVQSSLGSGRGGGGSLGRGNSFGQGVPSGQSDGTQGGSVSPNFSEEAVKPRKLKTKKNSLDVVKEVVPFNGLGQPGTKEKKRHSSAEAKWERSEDSTDEVSFSKGDSSGASADPNASSYVADKSKSESHALLSLTEEVNVLRL